MTSTSPWNLLCADTAKKTIDKIMASEETPKKVVKARDPSINGSFDEPVRKGRKPEVNKNHMAVLKCRELVLSGMALHRVANEVGVEYSMLARWYDKGWMEAPRKRRSNKEAV